MSRRATEYHRPTSLGEALSLLARASPRTKPLAGGTHVALYGEDAEALVDLRDLHLAGIEARSDGWRIGAMTSLASLSVDPSLPPSVRRAARREAPENLRTMATAGGTTALRCSGPFLCTLLAAAAWADVEPGNQRVALEDLVLSHEAKLVRGTLIVALSIPRGRRVGSAEISRTPEDRPLMCLSVGARLAQGRMHEVRVACGAYGQPLALVQEFAALLEGQVLPLARETARLAAHEPLVRWTSDIRASAAYRDQMVPVLLERAAEQLLES